MRREEGEGEEDEEGEGEEEDEERRSDGWDEDDASYSDFPSEGSRRLLRSMTFRAVLEVAKVAFKRRGSRSSNFEAIQDVSLSKDNIRLSWTGEENGRRSVRDNS